MGLDGHLDVVTANPGDNTISVFYGSGDILSFLQPRIDYTARPGPRASPAGVALARTLVSSS